MTKTFAGFDISILRFLHDLSHNNNRDWFNDNRQRYEVEVRQPALAFIESMGPRLKKISPHFRADAKKVGGSLMRIHRDIRFSKDKTPYKTNVGIHFRHEFGKDVHAPGFYFHIEPEAVFVGAGIWHPDSKTLQAIRQEIVERPAQWRRVRGGKKFREMFRLSGDSLKRPPRGFSSDHPMVEDLKRKDFIAVHELDIDQLFDASIVSVITDCFLAARPLMRFLCGGIRIPF